MKSKLLPPAYLLIFIVLTIAVHFIPAKRIIYPPYTYLGGLLIVIGSYLNVWADRIFKNNRTTIKPFEDPTSLQTKGPFKISRHPVYLGMTMLLFGISVLLGTIWTFIPPIIFAVIMDRVFIRFEEKNMEKVFASKYLAYKKKVRRWI